MGNRSKYLALTAAAGVAVAAASRRARLRRALEQASVGIADRTIDTAAPDGEDVAHAPGHRHLPPAPGTPAPRRSAWTPWSRAASRRWEPYAPR